MKRKYRCFMQNHMYALVLVHRASGGVKTYIREVLNFRRGSMKLKKLLKTCINTVATRNQRA